MSTDSTKISVGLSRRIRSKFSLNAKITLAACTVLSFIGIWDLIARMEHRNAKVDKSAPAPDLRTHPQRIPFTPAPWPTIPPLSEIPPIPTLAPTSTTWAQFIQAGQVPNSDGAGETIIQLAPLPMLAPLPTLAPLPDIPEPPSLSPLPAFVTNNHSGGS